MKRTDPLSINPSCLCAVNMKLLCLCPFKPWWRLAGALGRRNRSPPRRWRGQLNRQRGAKERDNGSIQPLWQAPFPQSVGGFCLAEGRGVAEVREWSGWVFEGGVVGPRSAAFVFSFVGLIGSNYGRVHRRAWAWARGRGRRRNTNKQTRRLINGFCQKNKTERF